MLPYHKSNLKLADHLKVNTPHFTAISSYDILASHIVKQLLYYNYSQVFSFWIISQRELLHSKIPNHQLSLPIILKNWLTFKACSWLDKVETPAQFARTDLTSMIPVNSRKLQQVAQSPPLSTTVCSWSNGFYLHFQWLLHREETFEQSDTALLVFVL